MLQQFRVFFLITFIVSMVHCECTSEVYSVLAGYPVTYSGHHPNFACTINGLDNPDYAWCALSLNTQQWIKVSSMNLERWTAVITQGRASSDQWVTQYQVGYTLNGDQWFLVDNGRIFQGNTDRNTKRRNNFDRPVVARAIRIQPIKWNNHISLRFDAIFQRI